MLTRALGLSSVTAGVLGRTAICCGVLIGSAVAQVEGQTGNPEPQAQWTRQRIIDIVRAQESAARYIAGSGQMTSKIVDAAGAEHPAGEHVAEFVREFGPAGRIRIDSPYMTLHHEDGVQIWRSDCSCGYDGKVVWNWERETQRVDEPGPVIKLDSAAIRYDRKDVCLINIAPVGWWQTLPGRFESILRRTSDVLQSDDGWTWRVDPDNDDLTIVRESPSQTETWLLRADWGHCLAQKEVQYAKTAASESAFVLEAEHVGRGLWYPTRLHTEHPRTGGTLHIDVTIRDVRLLDEVDESLFEPRFTHGTRVVDSATNQVVVVAGSDREVDSGLDRQADELRGLVRFRAAGLPWWRYGCAFALLAAGCLSLSRFRRRQHPTKASRLSRSRVAGGSSASGLAKALRGAGKSMSGLLAVGFCAGASAQSPWLVERIEHHKISNCAVQTVALVAKYFGQDCSVEESAALLGCSEKRFKAVGLDRMRQALEQKGLHVEGFQRESLDRITAAASARRGLAVLHTKIGTGQGHYYVLGPAPDGVVVANPMRETGKHAWGSSMLRRLAEASTGGGLLVSELEEGEDLAWLLDGESRRPFVRGGLRPEQHLFEVPIRNPHDYAIELARAESACGCFRGAVTRSGTLSPGAADTLLLTVDAAVLGTQSKRQPVALHFQRVGGGSPFTCHVDLECSRGGDPHSVKPCVFPTSLRPSTTLDGRHLATVQILVPDGGAVADWRSAQQREGFEFSLVSMKAASGGVVCTYQVRWHDPGEQDDWLLVLVRDRDGQRHRLRSQLLPEKAP